ncbi:lysin A, glycosyl hyrdrolase domain [Gordonia phage SallySpecial]|uniref:Lysin A, glycosyl hyrdrolase domain n=1 Tax=Gordonia phage SallySpecial TaxID=2079570 RepID=A0A2P1CC19_9CAUD|nr:lysin A, glycosyl hyrdrolase domain [Gordonia phage SallySpecial]AVJ48754.1 lysin A, glycosyl hyrdrolase domain [Gordonia phage SallySpecial]
MRNVVGHKEYSAEGKIDPAGIDMAAFGRDVQALIKGGNDTREDDADMALTKVQDTRLYQVWVQTAESHPVRQVFQKVFYNVKDGRMFTRAGLADVWNETVWDGFVNPVDLLDGMPDPDAHTGGKAARRGSLLSYVLATYREATLANRRAAALIIALERQGTPVDRTGLHMPDEPPAAK